MRLFATVLSVCTNKIFAVPDDYDDLLSYYTKRGYRVIAMAGKSVEELSWLKAQKMKRFVDITAPMLEPTNHVIRSEQAESGLRFLGLIIFENKLKPGTTPAIQALRSTHFVCRMFTGDNPLTAVSVARECSLVNPAALIFSPVFIMGQFDVRYLRWQSDIQSQVARLPQSRSWNGPAWTTPTGSWTTTA